MIERLRRALQHVDELSPEVQDELAREIEECARTLDDHEPGADGDASAPPRGALPRGAAEALALAGAWSDMLDDDELEASERIRRLPNRLSNTQICRLTWASSIAYT
jgi:hypothetical protein